MTAESRQIGGLQKFAIWLIASGLLLLVLSTGAGRLLEGSDSALSLSLYPVNAEAEVRGAVATGAKGGSSCCDTDWSRGGMTTNIQATVDAIDLPQGVDRIIVDAA